MPNEITEQLIDELQAEIKKYKRALVQVKARLSRIKEKTLMVGTALEIIERALEGSKDA